MYEIMGNDQLSDNIYRCGEIRRDVSLNSCHMLRFLVMKSGDEEDVTTITAGGTVEW